MANSLMEFQTSTITLQWDPGLSGVGSTKIVVAKEGVGSNLAYWKSSDGYILVHIPSGYSLCSRPVSEEIQAQYWLEAVAPLYNWSQPLEPLLVKELSPEINQLYTRIIELRQAAIEI